MTTADAQTTQATSDDVTTAETLHVQLNTGPTRRSTTRAEFDFSAKVYVHGLVIILPSSMQWFDKRQATLILGYSVDCVDYTLRVFSDSAAQVIERFHFQAIASFAVKMGQSNFGSTCRILTCMTEPLRTC